MCLRRPIPRNGGSAGMVRICVDEYAARAQRSVNRAEDCLFFRPLWARGAGAREATAASQVGSGPWNARTVYCDSCGKGCEPLTGLVEHLGSASISSTVAPFASLQYGLRQRARASAEVDYFFRLGFGNGICGSRQHFLVRGNESADGLIVRFDFKAQMASDGMAHWLLCEPFS